MFLEETYDLSIENSSSEVILYGSFSNLDKNSSCSLTKLGTLLDLNFL